MTKCVTVDIDVPASSEIVFEGYIDLDDVRDEGPYGEYTGYYGEAMVQPTFHLKCVTHRKNPYYISCTSAHVASECLILHYPQPFSWYRRMKTEVVGFRDAFLPLQGRNFMAIVQIKKRYPGWGKQAIMSALGSGFAAAIINWLIVVDEDIDIYNWDQVLFALATRVDPQLDILTFPPMAVNALNPSARARVPESQDFPYTNFALLLQSRYRCHQEIFQRTGPAETYTAPLSAGYEGFGEGKETMEGVQASINPSSLINPMEFRSHPSYAPPLPCWVDRNAQVEDDRMDILRTDKRGNDKMKKMLMILMLVLFSFSFPRKRRT